MSGSLEERLRYNNWANLALYNALETAEAPAGAMRAFQHVLETEVTWSSRILGLGNPKLKLWEPVSAEIRAEWVNRARAQMARISAEEAPGGFARTFAYENFSGAPFEDSVVEVLEHTLLHSAQYRGEAAGLSNASGVQMPDLDYIIWQRSGRPR